MIHPYYYIMSHKVFYCELLQIFLFTKDYVIFYWNTYNPIIS